MSTSSLIFPESILSHSLVPRPFVEKYESKLSQYECFKISVPFCVFRYTYNYAHAHIDDIRTYIYIYMEKSRHSTH